MKRKIYLIALVVLANGCSTAHGLYGPISGKGYSSTWVNIDKTSGDPDRCYEHYYYIDISRNEFIKECREYLIGKNPQWSKEIKDLILNSKYALGFNKLQLLATLGWPQDINGSVHKNIEREQWIYNNYSRLDFYSIDKFYIYIENGIVTSYQD